MRVKPSFKEGVGEREIIIEDPFGKTAASIKFSYWYLKEKGLFFVVDKDCRLIDPNTWCSEYVQCIAEREGLELTNEHWEVIKWAREFYKKNEIVPLIKILSRQFNTRELYALFCPSSHGEPSRVISLLAGLPKPRYHH